MSTIFSAYSRYIVAATTLLFLFWGLRTWSWPDQSPNVAHAPVVPPAAPAMPTLPPHSPADVSSYLSLTSHLNDYLTSYPLTQDDFGQMGKRLQILKSLVKTSDTLPMNNAQLETLTDEIEKLASSLVPFINNPNKNEPRPLRRLRSSFVPGSRGVVITTGKKRFRFACHLVLNLRNVLGSTLPIQVAYAGEDDLPKSYRDEITGLGEDITTLDVTSLFDDSTLGLPQGGWAIKAFAALGSTFEQAMHVDADAVFLQRPEVIFDSDPSYMKTGVLLYHDRLLWQGAFKERHDWWEKELAHTELSETIKHSKVYIDKYAEEGDSGVVVVDKARLDVFIGLLHVCWQNTKAVRDAWTYTQGYGDKESWWFGFELAGTPYSMEEHYATMLGHAASAQSNLAKKVCSFTIAHLDHKNKLLWYNGSLLKNKEVNLEEYDVPLDWMVDGVWEKGATKQNMSCMKGAEIRHLDKSEVEILTKSIEGAKVIDEEIRQKLTG